MKLVYTSSATPGFKHIEEQTNLSDFGFISYCSLPRQTKLNVYLPKEKKEKQEGVEE